MPPKSSAKTPTTAPALGRPVLVTTEHRGVFFGYLKGEATAAQVTLDRPRNVLYWPTAQKGFLGLCTTGPVAECRIGPAAEESTLFKITGVFGCTAAARDAFEAAPWK